MYALYARMLTQINYAILRGTLGDDLNMVIPRDNIKMYHTLYTAISIFIRLGEISKWPSRNHARSKKKVKTTPL